MVASQTLFLPVMLNFRRVTPNERKKMHTQAPENEIHAFSFEET